MSNLKDKILNLISISDIKQNTNAVVCLLMKDNDIFFIRRSNRVPTHKGDIAFIGGNLRKGENLLDCAWREFKEETSLSTKILDYHGRLRNVSTSSSLEVAVLVFEIKISKSSFLKEVKSNGEWEECFFINTKTLENSENWTFINRFKFDRKDKIYFCNLNLKEKNLWGMTALILKDIFFN